MGRRSLTTVTLRTTKRTGASPQQHCETQNERELHRVGSNLSSGIYIYMVSLSRGGGTYLSEYSGGYVELNSSEGAYLRTYPGGYFEVK